MLKSGQMFTKFLHSKTSSTQKYLNETRLKLYAHYQNMNFVSCITFGGYFFSLMLHYSFDHVKIDAKVLEIHYL